MPGSEIFRRIDEATTRDDVLDVLAEFYRARGFNSFCFVIPMVTKPDQFRLYERGMPPEWMRRYLERDFDLIDPVSTAATTRSEVGTLGELLKQLTVNDVGRLFVEEATRMGLTDGPAIDRLGGALFRVTFYAPLEKPDSGDRQADIAAAMGQINSLI